jgi:hypothetical protein
MKRTFLSMEATVSAQLKAQISPESSPELSPHTVIITDEHSLDTALDMLLSYLLGPANLPGSKSPIRKGRRSTKAGSVVTQDALSSDASDKDEMGRTT